ncbi:DUF1330 domain-containing protein [Pirellula sp. SH-Sr6A]|uniref:DUF1330 domain-containing protein n=1 Tax=Pirellula sp. SH-Sr6A TaxID=1632865 RepID=UPI0039655D23
MIFIREKTIDRAELESYWSKAPATLEGVPIKVLSSYGPHTTLEGPNVEGVVIVEFPSVEIARQWYDSPAYQDAVNLRKRGAIYRGWIVEGTPS